MPNQAMGPAGPTHAPTHLHSPSPPHHVMPSPPMHALTYAAPHPHATSFPPAPLHQVLCQPEDYATCLNGLIAAGMPVVRDHSGLGVVPNELVEVNDDDFAKYAGKLGGCLHPTCTCHAWRAVFTCSVLYLPCAWRVVFRLCRALRLALQLSFNNISFSISS